MSKYVSVSGFSHTFSSSDWSKLCTLAGRRSGRVDLSEGFARIDDGTVFITLPSPGGQRTYDVSEDDLF
jgi:hypothetical protein